MTPITTITATMIPTIITGNETTDRKEAKTVSISPFITDHPSNRRGSLATCVSLLV
jgi:hypothetical protein